MDETSIIAAQKRIDEKVYPPTHDYELATMMPRGVLAERVERILAICPDFFRGKRFLDIGASKGFFSMKAATGYGSVVAVEPDSDALSTWDSVLPFNVDIRCMPFHEFESQHVFDMIWIGNGPHYLFREDSCWQMMLKLYASDRVVVEGPVENCPDLEGFGEYQTEKQMIAAIAECGLKLKAQILSPGYTPGRKIWYFRTR